jgi:uncharacterized short protein YbdD (DUF466 family)
MNVPGLSRLVRAWHALRSITGDDAYERYLAHQHREHPGAPPLDARSFYVREQERRFSSGPTRCC